MKLKVCGSHFRQGYIPLLLRLPFNITIFCFDFAGSGLSDGECPLPVYTQRFEDELGRDRIEGRTLACLLKPGTDPKATAKSWQH
eukprot:3086622-Amphidinium_carterae.1